MGTPRNSEFKEVDLSATPLRQSTSEHPDEQDSLLGVGTGLSHTAHFINSGEITSDSIAAGCKTLGGVPESKASLIALGTMSVAAQSGCPYAKLTGGGKFFPGDVKKSKHPCDSGIIDSKGNFNRQMFDRLKSKAVADPTGQNPSDIYVTADIINAHKKDPVVQELWKAPLRRNVWRELSFFSKDAALPAITSRLFNILDQLRELAVGAGGTIGEFMLLFDVMSRHPNKSYYIKHHNVEYLSVTALERFYLDGKKLFEEIAKAVHGIEMPVAASADAAEGPAGIRSRRPGGQA